MIGYTDSNGSPIMVFFFVAIIIVVTVYAIIQSAKKKQLHSDAMLDFTLRNKLEFSPYDILSVITSYSYNKLMQQGHDQEASNLIYGKIKDRDFIFFDFKYKVSSGKSETTYEFGVVTIELPVLFKDLFIRSENVLDKIAGAIGFDDINFESEEFSRAFYVKSPDKKFAYDIIHSAVMQLLLENKELTIELNSNSIMFYKTGVFMTGDYDKASYFVNKFVDLIPEYVMNSISDN